MGTVTRGIQEEHYTSPSISCTELTLPDKNTW